MEELIQLMHRLRDPDTGCPWDRAQSFDTIAPYTIEEAYEVADAIARGDLEDLREELGDLLFQVVFHAEMAAETGAFDFAAVVRSIVDKMVRRHPHVFSSRSGQASDEAAVRASWDAIKAEERRRKARPGSTPSALDDVPAALPALPRAQKLQQRAAQVGFDWHDVRGVHDKLHEEVGELDAALLARSIEPHAAPARMAEELGDVLFTCVNLARHHGIDAERALRETNHRFERRFRWMEEQCAARGQVLEARTEAELDTLWAQAKAAVG